VHESILSRCLEDASKRALAATAYVARLYFSSIHLYLRYIDSIDLGRPFIFSTPLPSYAHMSSRGSLISVGRGDTCMIVSTSRRARTQDPFPDPSKMHCAASLHHC